MRQVADANQARWEQIYESNGFPGSRDYSIDQACTIGYLAAKFWQTKVDVATISDRSPLNLEGMTEHSERFKSFRLRGVVLSGGELDQDIERIMAFESILRAAYDGEPEQMERLIGFEEAAEPIDRGDFILQRRNEITDEWQEFFRVAHETYDAKKLRAPDGEGDSYRQNLGNRIVAHLLRIAPDLVFLDNYKVILPPNVIQSFPGQIINVHPSVLPLIKGYRPEKRAFEGENPKANGYTIHVVSEDLDGGPTLLQQRVPILPFDKELHGRIGSEAYARFREEQARLRIMVAQSPLIPWVLHIYGGSLDRVTVEDKEAFTHEGRPNFMRTKAYKQALVEEPDAGPYKRILFENPLAYGSRDDQPKYVTLEQMLSVPPAAKVSPLINGIHHYDFSVPVLTDYPKQASFTDIEYLVHDLCDGGINTMMQTGNITYDGAEVSLRSLSELSSLLGKMRIPYRHRQQLVHVQTPRQPVAARRLMFAD